MMQPENTMAHLYSCMMQLIGDRGAAFAEKKHRGGDGMARKLEFFFDYGSPFSYLADTQLKGLAECTGAPVVYRPILL
jgi:hypothetical protein